MFEAGKTYMVCLPYGWVFVGRYVSPAGLGHRWEEASYVVRTGGTPWVDYAAGRGRDKATTKRFEGDYFSGLQIIWACEWKGDLP
jgi:hypothetical protein